MSQAFKLAPMRRLSSTATVLLLSLALGACVPVALTAAGVGGSVMATHQLGGVTFRTFSEPLLRVREAALEALRRMEIGSEQPEDWPDELIHARAGDRVIEIELEAVTPATTRMKVVVRREGGLLVDAATALEIVNQTAKLLPTP